MKSEDGDAQSPPLDGTRPDRQRSVVGAEVHEGPEGGLSTGVPGSKTLFREVGYPELQLVPKPNTKRAIQPKLMLARAESLPTLLACKLSENTSSPCAFRNWLASKPLPRIETGERFACLRRRPSGRALAPHAAGPVPSGS